MVAPRANRTPETDAKVCAGIIATLALPAILTLRSVRVPQSLVPLALDPTPLGYTRSLSLFAAPILVLAWWFLRHPAYRFQRRAFGRTLAILVLLSLLLELLKASVFFTFKNRAATLGIDVPVIGGVVPIEEFAFYVLGFLATLLTYIWCDEYWLGAYKVPDFQAEAREVGRVVQFHLPSLLVGVVLIVAGLIYKRFVSASAGTVPGYFIFLVSFALVPSLFLFPTARPFLNWRALSFTFFLLILISLLWEATLGVPYQWWGFQDRQMLGLYIDAWCRLPVEEIVVWMAVTSTTVIFYEVVKVFLAREGPWFEALFGKKG
jgi:hypothetical protein